MEDVGEAAEVEAEEQPGDSDYGSRDGREGRNGCPLSSVYGRGTASVATRVVELSAFIKQLRAWRTSETSGDSAASVEAEKLDVQAMTMG
jgi:hypothetical protein